MFPPQFDYRRADSVEQAVDLLTDSGDRTVRPLAGGHGIVPDAKAGEAAPDLLVDVSGLDGLAGIEAGDGTVTVGALATHADLASSDTLRERVPVVPAAADRVADVQIRNRGTIGGNLAEADPAADLPAAVLAADARIRLQGPDGDREVSATEFFQGDGETALAADELLTAVEMPVRRSGAYVKKTHPATGYAMVGVAAVATVAAGTVSDARVAANGVMDRAVRLRAVEEALAGADVAPGDGEGADPSDVAARSSDSLDPDRQVGDVHASAEFRATVLETCVERALETVVDEAAGGGEPA